MSSTISMSQNEMRDSSVRRRTICCTTWTWVGYRAECRSLAGPTDAGLLFRAEGSPGRVGATNMNALHG